MPEFQETIISWYHQNKRNLPWRETTNPYFIWLSEIILQQTRIEQGTSYYLKFIKRFPTIKDLAQANEQEVLNLWQGLGYYSRASKTFTFLRSTLISVIMDKPLSRAINPLKLRLKNPILNYQRR
jgi:adenine-specific DNA glycosylase